MALGRSVLQGVAGLLLMGGCASMQNTVAQDLAWERWKKCNHFRSITLKEIKTDGTIWVWNNDAPNDVAAWRACDRAARAEQAMGVKASIPSSTLTVAAPNPASAMVEPPVWRRGDEWAYRYESPTGNGTYIRSVDREEEIDGVPHYVLKTGPREIFYRKSDFALTRETLDGVLVVRFTPSRLSLPWPLEVGKAWEQTFQDERPANTAERIDMVSVEGTETITVPAGTFRTFKIVRRHKKTGAIQYEVWYSLELKQAVRMQENLASGLSVRELIAFKLR